MEISRRRFMQSVAATGTSLLLANGSLAQNKRTKSGTDDLNIALIGAGAEGRVLTEAILRIPGIRFKAICDIWDYSLNYTVNYLKKFKHDVKGYEDYKELLAQEKSLDAVVIATPDWMHAEHANACLNAGLHVYCEKEMSNSLEKARTMVQTARTTGKLLQIGHQRRSNPRYIHAFNKLIKEVNLIGRVTHGYGQWNRSKSEDLGWPAKYVIPQDKLDKYGYASMTQFRNWRWYKKYGGGPIVDLGSHQIDLFSWVWGTNPRSVMASGGIDFYKSHEWYDNVLTVYEYENPKGVIARAFYQVLTTTKHGGFYETFLGEDGAIVISEVAARGNVAEREAHAAEWDQWVKKGYLNAVTESVSSSATKNVAVDVRVTAEAGKWPLPIELAKPAHQPHLENFFDAIRSNVPLNCPAEVAYETAVAVLAANESVATGKRVDFKPEEFRV
ncbi:MAG: Gfo/Idh/MocA family oxidoreductase [Kiritimatiellae bacterium]|nr:Gfo/Idh/MocA family oxidoreductase [Kiritimatiellia bacterium]MDD5522117.1 Gfo/Idh/MocA family oxidoreductase [Kiritimatiellia bacterium]